MLCLMVAESMPCLDYREEQANHSFTWIPQLSLLGQGNSCGFPTRSFPILGRQPENARKLAGIMRNHSEPTPTGDSGDHEIVGSDEGPSAGELSTDAAIFNRRSVIKGKRLIRCEKRRQLTHHRGNIV